MYTLRMISFILNIPYTLIGILIALCLLPKTVKWGSKPYRIVFEVKNDSFGLSYAKGWRGMTVGHTIILNPQVEEKDLEHEIIHVDQYQRLPLIYPILYYFEMWKHGYRNNKYEEEAYSKAGNVYRGDQPKD